MKTFLKLVAAVLVFPVIGMIGWLTLGQERSETLLYWIAIGGAIALCIGAACTLILLLCRGVKAMWRRAFK